ncbi:hypothetical protein PSTT_01536 [Puccinia striiformis]|uniref:Uncharacterized protein n=1 Tax=Puccinia striiformis TaxID=27350 RepID=A0A2S4W3G8_9BASI|nr:hypothetical protein PSTT_01536 [Puccinia striiformis]
MQLMLYFTKQLDFSWKNLSWLFLKITVFVLLTRE